MGLYYLILFCVFSDIFSLSLLKLPTSYQRYTTITTKLRRSKLIIIVLGFRYVKFPWIGLFWLEKVTQKYHIKICRIYFRGELHYMVCLTYETGTCCILSSILHIVKRIISIHKRGILINSKESKVCRMKQFFFRKIK